MSYLETLLDILKVPSTIIRIALLVSIVTLVLAVILTLTGVITEIRRPHREHLTKVAVQLKFFYKGTWKVWSRCSKVENAGQYKSI